MEAPAHLKLDEPLESDSSFLLAALSTIDEAVLGLDAYGRIRIANSAVEDLLGISSGEIEGEDIRSVLEGDGRKVTDLRVAVLEGTECEIRLPDGLLGYSGMLKAKVRPLPQPSEKQGTMVVLKAINGMKSVAQELKRRANLERVLVELSQFFVSSEEFNTDELLSRIGEAINADHVYLITAPPDDAETGQEAHLLRKAHELSSVGKKNGGWPICVDSYEYRDWWSDNEAAIREQLDGADDRQVAYAVPILSARDKMYGYLGIEYRDQVPEWLDDSARLLDVLGDMLSTYLERQLAEKALRASEERYRLFVTAISEGIWCLEPKEPIPTSLPPEEQLELLKEHTEITECNHTMAQMLGETSRDAVLGKRLRDVVSEEFNDRYLLAFIKNNYVLNGHEYVFDGESEAERHFIANAVGTHDGDCLTSIWGSWTDVTGRVELERRMVTALEQQQQRIGHDLHDGVGQLVTSVSILSQNLAERYLDEETPGHAQAMKIVRFTREAQQLLRELQRGLAPVQVQGRTLVQSLEGLTRNTDDLPGISCTFHHDGITDTDQPDLKLQLYRIAQEAINNALKHAEPSHISVRFTTTDGVTRLEVADNGTGFNSDEVSGESLGLVSIQYRARSLNADANIDSTVGEGTTVWCAIDASRF